MTTLPVTSDLLLVRPDQAPPRARVAATALDPTAVYLSHLGRRCRVVALGDDGLGRDVAHLAYDTPSGRAAKGAMVDGFALTEENWHFMRRVS